MSPLPVEALDRCADLPALICEFGPDSTLTYVNKMACDFFGMVEEELIGRRILDFVSPEARHSLWKRYLSLTPERPFAVSVEEVRRRGKSSWLEWRNRAFFDESGELLFCRSVGIDVTARRRMEETLRESGRYLQRMRQRMADGFWMVDIEGRILDVNGAYCRMTGYSRKELLSMRLTDLNPFDEPSVIKARIERVRLRGSDRLEIRQRCKDGSVLELEIVTAYMDVHDGRFVTIGRDISERKRMEEALLAAKENAEWLGRQAEAANRAKSAFLANTSHELRTPLNGVTGFLDLLACTALDSTQREYLEGAAVSAQSLLDVIGKVLDISKIEAGRVELETVRTDLPEFLQQVVQVVRSAAERKGLSLHLKLDDALPRYAYVDSTRLRQVLVNLLGNAVKFTHKGFVELSLGFEALQDGSGAFTFSVKDTGIGIGEEARKRIFEPFVQAEASTTRRFGGTGLGLTICEALLKMMGSSLELESVPCEGSRFFFTLRARYEHAEERAAEPAPGEAGSWLSRKGAFMPLRTENTPVILIVEDQKMNRKLLRLLIAKLLPDARIAEAEDGAEGVEMFERCAPDIVFMDVHMPAKDGFEAAKEMRAFEEALRTKDSPGRRTSIVALTGDVTPETREAALRSGMDDVLLKPVNSEELRECLEKSLRRPE